MRWLLGLCSPAACAGLSVAAWCESRGATTSCRVGQVPGRGYRGLLANSDLAAGDVALRIPRALATIEADDREEHWAGRLASKLLRRMQSGDDYAASLPEPPDGLGRWDDDDHEALQNTTLEAEAASLFFWRHDQLATHGEGFEEDAFLDALDLACSRALRCGDTLLLVPLLDMANHASEAEGGGFYECDGDHVNLRVGARGAKAGEEVTLSYGDRESDHFLLHHGFVPAAPNRRDSATLDGGGEISWGMLAAIDAAAIDAARRTLDAMPTTYGEDLRLLAADVGRTMAPRARLALEYRVNKKMLLAAAAGADPTAAAASPFERAFIGGFYE
ncbi:hypothetical protein M885DRAFT_510768 [Pelagophyceae sp. CCMP2097]|nr:hypothetical protein M885DRAFT_510768 [Pelagophyceae sp. CCMP2097]